ncbi:radical SAM protein [bacterium]|nr:radical SAM protein [bacterium]
MAKRIVLCLNPPGDKRYLRDNYCSHASKAHYYWHPYDLLVQAGVLGQKHEVLGLDANVRGYSFQKTHQILANQPFDAILFLTGAVSWKEDFRFVHELVVRRPGLFVCTTGDIGIARSTQLLEQYPWIDSVLMDFTVDSLSRHLAGEIEPGEELLDYAYRHDGAIVDTGKDKKMRRIELPFPRYDLFPSRHYTHPCARRYPFASIMTDFGCPYTCTFCITGQLGYKLRDLDNVLSEMHWLWDQGYRELYVKDSTFGVHKKHHNELLDRMMAEGLAFSWFTLSRANVLNEALIEKMARAGCHTVQIGVESVDEEILKNVRKGIKVSQVMEVFQLCRKHGIRTLAHFTIGFPGETEESALRTIEFAKVLDSDFASFNIATPRLGTPYRDQAIAEGWTDPGLDVLDNSLQFPQINMPQLSAADLWRLRSRAVREFHLRPHYLWRTLKNAASSRELLSHLRQGYYLFAGLLRGG